MVCILKNAALVSSAVLAAAVTVVALLPACSRSIAISRKEMPAICGEGCNTMPERAFGMKWEDVTITTVDGHREVYTHRNVKPDFLRAENVACIKFTRSVASRIWGGIGAVGVPAGLVAGRVVGEIAGGDGSVSLGSHVYPFHGTAAALAFVVGSGLGALGLIWLAGPDEDVPENACTAQHIR